MNTFAINGGAINGSALNSIQAADAVPPITEIGLNFVHTRRAGVSVTYQRDAALNASCARDVVLEF